MKALAAVLIIGGFLWAGNASAVELPRPGITCHLTIGEHSVTFTGDCPAGARVATYIWHSNSDQTLYQVGTTAAIPCGTAWQADLFNSSIETAHDIDATHDFRSGFIAGTHGVTQPCPTPTPFTAPPDSTTTTAPPTPSTVPFVPPSSVPPTSATPPTTTTELARTGIDSFFWTMVALGFIIGGMGFCYTAWKRDRT